MEIKRNKALNAFKRIIYPRIIHSHDITLTIKCDNNYKSIAKKVKKTKAWAKTMMIDRRGEAANSNMTTCGLHNIVEKKKSYICKKRLGLVQAANSSQTINLEQEVLIKEHGRAPQHVKLKAQWHEGVIASGLENVLGKSTYFVLDGDQGEVEIPVIEASNEGLLYYGAILVDENQIVSFPNDEWPIWKVEFGENYIEGFIMTKQGRGFYLECHADQPHWHQPLTKDSGGYYILGKRCGNVDSIEEYKLTGFKIPYGKAVYSKRGAIHCDAAITGKSWNIGYYHSNDYSTALVRNKSMELVRFTGK